MFRKKEAVVVKEEQKKVAPKKPISAQQTIKYDRMLEDGICEVQKGKIYSKSMRFADINYQLASYDERVEIFAKYCEFLNYFDPNTSVQITIHNTPMTKDSIKSKVLFKEKNDGLDPLRREYNNFVYNKLFTEQQTFTKDKFLSYSILSDSVDNARPILERFQTDINTNLTTLGCAVSPLNGKERIEILHQMMNPEDVFNYDKNSLLESNITSKDVIAPPSFTVKTSQIQIGETYASVLFLRDLPPSLTDKVIAEIADAQFELTLNIHFIGIDQAKALDLIKLKITFMEQQKSNEQRKAIQSGYDPDIIPLELKYSLDEAHELLDSLQSKSQRMFLVTILVMVTGTTEKELENNVQQIRAIARKNGCNFAPLNYQQVEGFNSTLPLGKNYVDIQRTLTTASTAIFVPFTSVDMLQEHGIYYGLNAISKNPIIFNRKTLKNPNGFTLGTPGSGKSFASKREIASVLLNTSDDVLVIDPEREYANLAEGMGGSIIHISAGSESHINPMELNRNYAGDDNPLLLKSEFILSLFNIIIGERNGLAPMEKSILDRVVRFAYDSYVNKGGTMPTLKDFWKILAAQNDPVAQNLATALELYIQGSLSVFAHPTNVNTDNRFIVFDIRDLGNELKTMGMLIALDFIWNRITQNREEGKRTWVYIDEIYLLFQNEYSAGYLYQLFKRSRKWGAIVSGLTQNVEDMLGSATARTMLANTDYLMLLNQAPTDREVLKNLLKISDQEIRYVSNSPAGQGMLLIDHNILPFVDRFPTETQLYKMMTTKPEEMQKNAKKTASEELSSFFKP
jgi:type IV secretory pathway VirB4 component